MNNWSAKILLSNEMSLHTSWLVREAQPWSQGLLGPGYRRASRNQSAVLQNHGPSDLPRGWNYFLTKAMARLLRDGTGHAPVHAFPLPASSYACFLD